MDSMIDDIKVYIYILKKEDPNKEIYGYTVSKEIAKQFENQRNMKLFYRIVKRMDKYELMIFMNDNKSKQLCKDNLYDGERDYQIIATIDESSSLSESCDSIFSTIIFINDALIDYKLKDKYLKAINEITDFLNNKRYEYSNINTFKLFYHLFRETFYEDINESDDSLY